MSGIFPACHLEDLFHRGNSIPDCSLSQGFMMLASKSSCLQSHGKYANDDYLVWIAEFIHVGVVQTDGREIFPLRHQALDSLSCVPPVTTSSRASTAAVISARRRSHWAGVQWSWSCEGKWKRRMKVSSLFLLFREPLTVSFYSCPYRCLSMTSGVASRQTSWSCNATLWMWSYRSLTVHSCWGEVFLLECQSHLGLQDKSLTIKFFLGSSKQLSLSRFHFLYHQAILSWGRGQLVGRCCRW